MYFKLFAEDIYITPNFLSEIENEKKVSPANPRRFPPIICFLEILMKKRKYLSLN